METVALLEKTLRQYQTSPPAEDLKLEGWRFSVSEQASVRAGIRNNRLGDVYAAPARHQGLSGDLLLIWQDELCSHAVINNSTVENIKDKLPLWRKAAFKDEQGSFLLEPEPLPLISVEHNAVKSMVQENPAYLFEILARYKAELKEGVNTLQAGAHARWGLRHVRTSKGLSVSYAQTGFSTYVFADGLFGKGFGKRRPPTGEEIDILIRKTLEMTAALKQPADIDSGETTVILSPELAEEFMGKYLMTNLSGNNVVNSQSAYSLNNFALRKQIFDPRISLAINPLKAYELSSYLCTGEGLPARVEYLVKDGKLKTPYLTVKDSRKSGLAPTPLPQAGGLWLEVQSSQSLDELIASTQRGILITSVLGMHTQDGTSGNYSLSAPNCLKIENGRGVGRVQVVITGNFLEHLASPATEYSRLEDLNHAPAMKFATRVIRG